MEPGEVIYLGDGAYLAFDGYGFELRANSLDSPTDRVYLEPSVALALVARINATLSPPSK